jgi:hypothetical protein
VASRAAAFRPPAPTPAGPVRRAHWSTWLALGAWVAVIVAARLVLLDLQRAGAQLKIPFPPLDARLDWRPGWPLVLPIAVGVLVVLGSPTVVDRVAWRRLLAGSWFVAGVWAVSLALLDGTSGIVGSVTLRSEYFLDIGRVGTPLSFLRGFTTHIAEYRVHVQGHPPGYLLFLWVLDRIGLGTPSAIATLEIAIGALAVPAVLVAVREIAGENVARRAAPFVAVAPVAIWVASSADALYAGVGACAVACVVVATGRNGIRSHVYALVGGLLFAAVAFLSYGLVLLAVIPIGIALRRRRWRPLAVAATSATAVFLGFALAGFWWFDGLQATRARYFAGVASRRPYWPFLLANAACFAIALGPAIAVALARLRDRRLWWLVGGSLAAVAVAGISGMSKGEVERIWLPFAVWVLPAGVALTRDMRRSPWLAIQVAFALFVQTLVRSPW